MKALCLTVFMLLGVVLLARAASSISVDLAHVIHTPTGATQTVSLPRITVHHGEPASIQISDSTYTVTPTANPDGTLKLRFVYAARRAGSTNDEVLVDATFLAVPPGQRSSISLGDQEFQIVPHLNK